MIGWRAGEVPPGNPGRPTPRVDCVACQPNRPARSALSSLAELRWRNVGPHRASRTRAAAGHASHPYTFYMAAVNGGVWKTTDAGRVWKPIFDDQPTGSIGTIAIAPSDANIDLRRQRRRAAPSGSFDGRRRLQVDRRRQDVDAPRIARRAADSRHRRRSDEPEPALRRRARPSVRSRTKSAASIARPTAARPSRRCSRRTRTPAATTSTSIRRIPRSSTPRCGRNVRARGRTRCGPAPTAASSSRSTAARPGSR